MFVPTIYHEKIFDFLEHGTGHSIIVAVAGSGKTTTLVELLMRVPSRTRTLFTSFSSESVEEIRRRVRQRARKDSIHAALEMRTLHSLGFDILRTNYRTTKRDDKLTYVFSKDETLIRAATIHGGQRRYTREMQQSIARVVSMAKATLTNVDDITALYDLIDHYNIDFDSEHEWALQIVPEILRACQRHTQFCDFDDMIYLPAIMAVPQMPKFDLILCDEAQDLNAAQIQLLLKVLAPHGRVIAVGDDRQSLYAFRGSNSDAMDILRELLSATILPLSITYRCPTEHVALAQRIVPHIQARPDAPRGIVRKICESDLLNEVQPGDMVICRTNVPLISLALSLIARGQKAKVQGRDIGASLRRLIERVRSGNLREMISRLDDLKQSELFKLEKRNVSALHLQAVSDKFDTVRTILESATSLEEMKRIVEDIATEHGDGVVFSSIHRAKGLEADFVYFLYPDKIPHPLAKRDYELVQEHNAIYVGLTRSRHELVLVYPDQV
jgi:DNA helicase-2/ATP-dependent DNA helicase PcrA